MNDGCMTPLKERYIPTRLQGITSQNAVIFLLYVVNLLIYLSTVWNIIGSSRQLGPLVGGWAQLCVAVWCHWPANVVPSGQCHLPASPLFANFNPLRHVAVQDASVRCPALFVHHMWSAFSITRLTSASVMIEITWRKRICWHHQIRPENSLSVIFRDANLLSTFARIPYVKCCDYWNVFYFLLCCCITKS
jgi:hypothetical protein